ncbi:MAG: hypothetical protein H7Y06_04225 [Opitutaceae bacterium]|nr:hypothetical protein [Opitutaceae bacterium]
MKDAPQPLRDLAIRLVACESKGGAATASRIPVLFPISEKFRVSLVVLLGSEGFSALMRRALALAIGDVAWLRIIRVAENGTLVEIEDPPSGLTPAEGLKGSLALVTRLLELLEIFIGERMTQRLVAEIWPRITRRVLKPSTQKRK